MSDPGTPQYGGQPQWGQQPPPGYGYAPTPTTSTNAILALVFAIGSFMVCPVVPAIVALAVFVPKARADIAQGQGGDGLVTAAKIVSLIHLALTAFVFLLFVGLLLAGGLASTSNG